MKLYLVILFVIFAAAALVFIFFYYPIVPAFYRGVSSAPAHPAAAQAPTNQHQVCFGTNCFFVELATTEAQREQGLMSVTQLDENKGMLFIFDTENVYPFWMKDTLIPLDMIWIGSNDKVVFVKQNAQPCKTLVCPVIDPMVKAKYVVEINGGISNQLGIKAGDIAKIVVQ